MHCQLRGSFSNLNAGLVISHIFENLKKVIQEILNNMIIDYELLYLEEHEAIVMDCMDLLKKWKMKYLC